MHGTYLVPVLVCALVYVGLYYFQSVIEARLTKRFLNTYANIEGQDQPVCPRKDLISLRTENLHTEKFDVENRSHGQYACWHKQRRNLGLCSLYGHQARVSGMVCYNYWWFESGICTISLCIAQ